MAVAFNSKQFSNGLARQFYLNYDDTHNDSGPETAPVAPLYQSDRLFMAFFQNTQATTDLTAWNSWVLSPSGTQPSYDDAYYPYFLNTDTSAWRNKLMYMVPCTRREMVEKDATGSIEYNGQNWEVVAAYDERETVTNDEPRYCYVECDMKYYDAAVNASVGITDKTLITGLGLYKTELLVGGGPEDVDFSAWVNVEYEAITKYEYKTHATINSAATNTRYDNAPIIAADLVYLYQNTFPAVVRSATLLTKFSLIIEF